MSEIKTGLDAKIKIDSQRGEQILSNAEQAMESRRISETALNSVEPVDDDTWEAVTVARRDAEKISETIAEEEIQKPGLDVCNSLKNTAIESNEYAGKEAENARTVAGMVNDFASVGTEASSKFVESSRAFQNIAINSDACEQHFNQEFDQAAADQRAPW
jgi:hypothetical protein